MKRQLNKFNLMIMVILSAAVIHCGQSTSDLSIDELEQNASSSLQYFVWADTDKNSYDLGEEGSTTLSNFYWRTVYLGGCANFSYESYVNGIWTDQGPDLMCVWEGTVRPIAYGESTKSQLILAEPGIYRLHYTVGIGCMDGKPMSQAACKNVVDVYTPPFEIKNTASADHCPACKAIGSHSEGWYWSDTNELIKFDNCAKQSKPECGAIGSRSEGWFNDNGLIVFDYCHKTVHISIAGEPCGDSSGFSCYYDEFYCQYPNEAEGFDEPGICRVIGTCQTVADCDDANNNWTHEMCDGFATCEEDRCEWKCSQ